MWRPSGTDYGQTGSYSAIVPFWEGARGCGALGTGCPKTPLRRRSQVTDSMCPEFPALDAHKELFLTAEIEGRDRPTLASETPVHIHPVDSVMHARRASLRVA